MKDLLSDAACSEEGCAKPRKSREWCHAHYMRRRNAGLLSPRLCDCGNPLSPNKKVCADCTPSCPDCGEPAKARGYCKYHYQRRFYAGEFGTLGACCIDGCDRNAVTRTRLCHTHSAKRSKYGLTLEELVAIEAGCPCAVCGDRAEYVDHCHATNRKRGFLCPACNSGLGFFRDDPKRLAAAIAYLAAPPLGER